MSQYSFRMERYCYYCHFTPGKHASYAGITAAMDFISWKKKKKQNFHNTESQSFRGGNHSEEAAPWTVKTTFRSSVAHTAHDSSFSNLSQASCSASSNIIVQTHLSCLPACPAPLPQQCNISSPLLVCFCQGSVRLPLLELLLSFIPLRSFFT